MNLDAIRNFKVLVVGDAIYDHYVFGAPLGKSIKETCISVRHEREETYRGGVWAGASHLTDFCAQVDVLHGGRAMVNTRYLEPVYNRKLFSVHREQEEMNDTDPEIGSYDCVIVCDFGHGTLDNKLIERVSKEARFLAVNAQTNSQNYGFNYITKYRRADYVVIDELEARLAAHDKSAPIEDVILSLGFPRIAVTLGANGAIGFDGEFHRERALADKIVDTIGAGDAFLCVSAPYAAAGFHMKDLVRIGNLAGAIKVGILGHRNHVTKDELERNL